MSVIDAYQSVGQLPVDAPASGVDVLITGGLKWLLGGSGIVYVYVRRDRLGDLAPTLTGWFAHRDQFAFDPRTFAFREDAGRFELGTPSVAAAYAGAAGLDLVLEIGVDRIRARVNELTRDLVERGRDAGFPVMTPLDDDRRAGIVMLRMPDAARAVQVLGKKGIVVDRRGDRLRASPFFANTEEENARLLDEAKPLLG